tara:strand:- start:860 stop:1207 length:348 start_codon:yes stop_codon:yes gene_type:complete
MALIIKTNDPSKLLSSIKKAIDTDKIRTWSYDSDGDFTHSPEQWKNKAWLRVKTKGNNELSFGILGQKEINTSKLIYAIYHGRFSEMLLSHFDNELSEIKVTSMPTSIDTITTNK